MMTTHAKNGHTATELVEREITATSELIDRFVDLCKDKKVMYCHWKSNFALTQLQTGEVELDILVDRKSLSKAIMILLDIGFKPAVVKRGPETPTVSHYYAFDSHTGQLIHIHLFCSVFTGESFIKSHVLPFETMLLENSSYLGKLRTVSKPAELAIFILRHFIKYGSFLDIYYLKGKNKEIKAELMWLFSENNYKDSVNLLREYCPVIDEHLFNECIDALSGHQSLAKKILLACRVRHRLRIYKKNTIAFQSFAYMHLLWVQLMRRLRRNKNKRLFSGGAVIAFVGPEATGKSTLVSAIEDWLGQVFAVSKVHAGKPVSTWLTWPLHVSLPLLRSRLPRLRTSRLEGHHPEAHAQRSQPTMEGMTSLTYALRAVALAWDRRCLLVKVRRAAVNGAIVICDRYPSSELGAMDSPRLQEKQSQGGLVTSLYNRLARLEHALYAEIPPPDIVLRLSVSIETAKRRNHERIKPGKETSAYVESRHRQSRDWHRAGTKYIYDINTDQSLEETILQAKRYIWESV